LMNGFLVLQERMRKQEEKVQELTIRFS
jgi:hypothetical protein